MTSCKHWMVISFLSRNYELLCCLHLCCHGSEYGFLSLYTYLFVYFLGRRCMFDICIWDWPLIPLWSYNIHVLVLLMFLIWMIQKVDNTFIYCLNWSRQNLKILSWLWKYGLVYSFERNFQFDATGLFLCYWVPR